MRVWVDRVEREEARNIWEVVWEFYRKPCAARTLKLARSAMPDRTKCCRLTQEATRIFRNTSLSVPWSRKTELLTDFVLRMLLSGYSESYGASII